MLAGFGEPYAAIVSLSDLRVRWLTPASAFIECNRRELGLENTVASWGGPPQRVSIEGRPPAASIRFLDDPPHPTLARSCLTHTVRLTPPAVSPNRPFHPTEHFFTPPSSNASPAVERPTGTLRRIFQYDARVGQNISE